MKNLEKIYKTLPSKDKSKEEKSYMSRNALQSLYGEITEKGVNQIIDNLKKHKLITHDGLFIDLGSGYGKMVLHMAMFDEIKESHGIELLESKAEHANLLLNELPKDFPKEKVFLSKKDILEVNELKHDIVYHNSISWNNKHISHVVDITKKSSIHITTNNLNFKLKRTDLKEIHQWPTSCSWNKPGKLTTMFVYEKIR
jgi:hypothetical protein